MSFRLNLKLSCSGPLAWTYKKIKMHVHACSCMYSCNNHACAYTCTCMLVHAYACSCTYSCKNIQTYACVCVHMHAYVCLGVNVHAYMRVNVCINKQIYIFKSMFMHMFACFVEKSLWESKKKSKKKKERARKTNCKKNCSSVVIFFCQKILSK